MTGKYDRCVCPISGTARRCTMNHLPDCPVDPCDCADVCQSATLLPTAV